MSCLPCMSRVGLVLRETMCINLVIRCGIATHSFAIAVASSASIVPFGCTAVKFM